MSNTDRALDLLRRAELSRLWNAARQRLERNGHKITTSPLDLTDLANADVVEICALLGRRRPANNQIRVSLAELDSALRSSSAQLGLIEALEATSGPIDDRLARRAAERMNRAALWQSVESHPIVGHEPVRIWLRSVRQRGRLTRLDASEPEALLVIALDCVEWLVSNRETNLADPLPLPVVAARLGDAHALDPDTPLGVLVADAVLALSGDTDARSAWLAFGVQLDNVNSSALAYMLPGSVGTIAGAACHASEPIRVTHRMLDRGFGLVVEPGQVVWVCENPSILALAADRLGSACQPLVCLEGMPSSATARLLTTLQNAGSSLRVHADFDLGGIAIMSYVTARFRAQAWRMSHDDYLSALSGPTSDLTQSISGTPWDPQLASAMNCHGRTVHEESVLSELLVDLSR